MEWTAEELQQQCRETCRLQVTVDIYLYKWIISPTMSSAACTNFSYASLERFSSFHQTFKLQRNVSTQLMATIR